MIEVRITQQKLESFNGNVIHAGLHTLERLRDAGVPAEGVLFPVGVKTGVLEIEFDDLAADEWVYRWRG